MWKDERHTAKSLALELGISERQVQRILKELKDSGTIERIVEDIDFIQLAEGNKKKLSKNRVVFDTVLKRWRTKL